MRKAPRSAPRRTLFSLFFALWLAGCGGAYGEAIARGDKFAEGGMWDKAAAEYEAATKLDPSDPEAQIKLKEARRKQAGERLERGRALLRRGEIAAGLAVIQEAAALDPESTEAQKALTDANDAALDEAEKLIDGGDGKKAFELTSLVLEASPRDPRARKVDGKVRDKLAEESYARAESFLAKKKTGNALIELAACLLYRPDFRDAKVRVGEVKQGLVTELMFHVVLDKFGDGGGGNREMAVTLTPELLARSFDERLPLRVVKELPKAVEAPRGVRVTGKFDGYSFAHTQNRVGRSCDYVCGTDTKENPAYAGAERSVADAERRLAQAEESVSREQREVDRYQKDVDRYQVDVDKAQVELDKARAELDRCRGSHPEPNACSSEQSRVDSKLSSLNTARNYLDSPKRSLESARDRMSNATDSRDNARRDKERATESMRTTPRTIEVERFCAHNYDVQVHEVAASVTVTLHIDNLLDKSTVLADQPFPFRVAQKDETFPAQKGRCAEVASGDPLDLPDEKAVKQELVTQTIGGVREKVMGTYDRYRQRFLADARREEASGLADEAVEAYVRYVLLGPKGLDPKDSAQIGDFLSKTRGFGKVSTLGEL